MVEYVTTEKKPLQFYVLHTNYKGYFKMRYISPNHRLTLIQKNGEVGSVGTKQYRFENGVLIIGQAKFNTTGNVIVPQLSNTDGTALQIVNSAGSSDLEKVGLGTNFFEAPDLTVADSTQALTSGLYYFVTQGTIVFGGTTYTAPARFKAGSSANFTGTGTVYADLTAAYYKQDEENFRAQSFPIVHTGTTDEGSWNDSTWGADAGVVIR